MVKNQRGSALAMVLILLAVGVTLGAGVLIIGSGERTQVSTHEKEMQAYLTARTGAEVTAGMISDKVLTPSDSTDTLDMSGTGTAGIEIDFEGNDAGTTYDDVIWIESEGRVQTPGSDAVETVAVRMDKRRLPAFEYAIDALQALDLDKIGEIDGDINSENGIIAYPDIFTGAGSTNPFSGQPVLLPPETNPEKTYSAGDTISESGYYTNGINSNQKLVFDTGGKDLYVKCRDFNVNKGIDVLGGGAAFIYTENLLMQQAQSDPEDMIVINVCDIDGLSIDNNNDFVYEYLDSPLSGDITANSDFYALINAPYVQDFDFSGNGALIGGIICYSFSDAGAGAHTKLTFESGDINGLADRMGFSISEYRKQMP